MDSRKKWSSPQAIIVMAIILLIFVYIGIDMAKTNPAIKADIKEIKLACRDKSNFIKLCNEVQNELDEAAFDLDEESKMNGV